MELASASSTRRVEAMNPILFTQISYRDSRSRERLASRERASPGNWEDAAGGALLEPAAGGTSSAAAGGACNTLCMILSSGRYSRFEPWRDSTRTLVTLP